MLNRHFFIISLFLKARPCTGTWLVVSMVTSAVWSSHVLQAWFFLLAFLSSRGCFLEVFGWRVLFTSGFYMCVGFCPGAHKPRVNVGGKLEVLAGEQGAAET